MKVGVDYNVGWDDFSDVSLYVSTVFDSLGNLGHTVAVHPQLGLHLLQLLLCLLTILLVAVVLEVAEVNDPGLELMFFLHVLDSSENLTAAQHDVIVVIADETLLEVILVEFVVPECDFLV